MGSDVENIVNPIIVRHDLGMRIGVDNSTSLMVGLGVYTAV